MDNLLIFLQCCVMALNQSKDQSDARRSAIHQQPHEWDPELDFRHAVLA